MLLKSMYILTSKKTMSITKKYYIIKLWTEEDQNKGYMMQ